MVGYEFHCGWKMLQTFGIILEEKVVENNILNQYLDCVTNERSDVEILVLLKYQFFIYNFMSVSIYIEWTKKHNFML